MSGDFLKPKLTLKIMSTKRKKSADYKADLDDLKQKQVALEARIIARCKEMIIMNPNVHMGTIDYANAPAAEVFTRDYLKNIDRHGMKTIFELMEAIEADLASKHPHKQTAIEF
jgi:hypothetical protein